MYTRIYIYIHTDIVSTSCNAYIQTLCDGECRLRCTNFTQCTTCIVSVHNTCCLQGIQCAQGTQCIHCTQFIQSTQCIHCEHWGNMVCAQFICCTPCTCCMNCLLVYIDYVVYNACTVQYTMPTLYAWFVLHRCIH